MTTIQIEEQIKVIQRATQEASKSKKSAMQFLTEAGIIKSGKKSSKSKG